MPNNQEHTRSSCTASKLWLWQGTTQVMQMLKLTASDCKLWQSTTLDVQYGEGKNACVDIIGIGRIFGYCHKRCPKSWQEILQEIQLFPSYPESQQSENWIIRHPSNTLSIPSPTEPLPGHACVLSQTPLDVLSWLS